MNTNLDAQAKFELAMKHIYGDDVAEDNELAASLLTEAYALGHVEATYNLGICYHYGYGVEADLERAFGMYLEAANAGYGKGMELVGRFYNRGIYVGKNREKAEYWLKKAMESDDLQAVEEAKKEYDFRTEEKDNISHGGQPMSTEHKFINSANYLLERIEKSTSPFHTVLTAGEDLDDAGFISLDFSRDWKLEYGGKYYVTVYDSTLIAFTVGDTMADEGNLRLAMAHTDFPCFKIKPSPEMKQNGYGRLNVEGYGGMLNYSWLDRPLSIAGKVALKGDDAFHPEVRFIDFARPVATIPSLAIHMNREANKGVEFNLQKDMLPIADILEESLGDEAFFRAAVAEECGADPEEILDYELYLYQYEKGELIGLNETMISSPRLDNITSVTACIKGLIQAQRGTGINMAVIFDHEEIGSRSKQGAAGSSLPYVIERIYLALGLTRDRYLKDITDGFALSVDVAHAMHTNSPEKNDPTNPVKMNGGVTIKMAARQSYVSSCESVAAVQSLCAMAEIPCQKFVNRSDMPGGGTLGSIAASYLPMQMQDVGVAMLAMHSARELMGVKDQYYLEQLVTCLFGFK